MSNENERERQEEYIEKCRVYVNAFQVEHGRLPKACVVTFGCQMNTVHETMKIVKIKNFMMPINLERCL